MDITLFKSLKIANKHITHFFISNFGKALCELFPQNRRFLLKIIAKSVFSRYVQEKVFFSSFSSLFFQTRAYLPIFIILNYSRWVLNIVRIACMRIARERRNVLSEKYSPRKLLSPR